MATWLSPTAQSRFRRLAGDLRRVFGPRFVSLVAYGPHRSAVFAQSIEPGDLDAMSALVETWHRDHLATPFVITPDELSRSLDAFPLEFQAMLDRHEVIDGSDPLAGIRIDPADLRRACEMQAKSHLVHLRQGWLEAHGHSHELAHLAARSAGPFRALLIQVARLSGEQAESVEELAAFAERTMQVPAGLGRDVLAADDGSDASERVAKRLAEYLTAAEHLWAYVDRWSAR
jgi:hypothetical protein